MRISAALVLTALATLVFPFTLPAQERRASAPATLPPVAASALDKSKVHLPADFSAPLNLLILSFSRDQQSSVESWLPVISEAARTYPKMRTWVLPVSARTDSLYKWWLNSSLRSSLPADQSEHYTVPLYVNKSEFLRALAIRSEKQIVLLVTNKSGEVIWRADGAASVSTKASLADFLKAAPLAR